MIWRYVITGKGTLFDWFDVDVIKLFSVGQMEKKLLFFRGIAINLIVRYKPSLLFSKRSLFAIFCHGYKDLAGQSS